MFQDGASVMDHFSYLCIVFVMLFPAHFSLVVTCGGRANLLALLNVMFYCVFVSFPCGVMGQMWILIVSITDICLLTHFQRTRHCLASIFSPLINDKRTN